MPSYQTPLDAAFRGESTWVEDRDGTNAQIGSQRLRGRFRIEWRALSYETAMRILHELRTGQVTFTPRTQKTGDTNDVTEVALDCRVVSDLPTASALYRRTTSGTEQARIAVELETLQVFDDIPGLAYSP